MSRGGSGGGGRGGGGRRRGHGYRGHGGGDGGGLGPNRAARVEIAKETLKILEDGEYKLDNASGKEDLVELKDCIEKCVQGAKCYT